MGQETTFSTHTKLVKLLSYYSYYNNNNINNNNNNNNNNDVLASIQKTNDVNRMAANIPQI